MRRLLIVLLLVTGCATASPARPSGTTRFTYDVVDAEGQRSQQVIDIQRPYRARTLTYRGGVSQGGFLWDETGTYNVGPDGTIAQTAAIGPGFPGPASDLAVSLPVALRQHRVVRKGQRTVGGAPCTRWLSDGPLDSGSPFTPPMADTTESCVDPRGVIVSERWTSDTGFVRSRALVSTSTGPADLYAGKQPLPLPSGQALSVVKASTPAELCRLLQIPVPAAPAGLRPDRATAVVDLTSSGRGFAREGAVLTWVGAGRLVVLRVERDLAPGGGRTVRGETVALGALGTGHLEPVLAGLRVLVEGPRGLRLIATADLPEDQLLSWLRSQSL